MLSWTIDYSSMCPGIFVSPRVLVVKVSREKISCMESCQSFPSHVLDVDISINYFCVDVLSCLGQNWSFILWSPDLQRRNNSLSIQVNFDTKNIWTENHDFRVPLLNRFRTFRFSSSMILLMWCVWGGFLLHILECNLLTVLVKPVYKKPIDTAEDIIERGITIIDFPGRESMVNMLKKSSIPLIRAMAEQTYVTKVFLFSSNFYSSIFF